MQDQFWMQFNRARGKFYRLGFQGDHDGASCTNPLTDSGDSRRGTFQRLHVLTSLGYLSGNRKEIDYRRTC